MLRYKDLEMCIHERFMKYALEEGKSIIDTHILFHYHIVENSKIIPSEHYSKILALSYRQTLNKIEIFK